MSEIERIYFKTMSESEISDFIDKHKSGNEIELLIRCQSLSERLIYKLFDEGYDFLVNLVNYQILPLKLKWKILTCEKYDYLISYLIRRQNLSDVIEDDEERLLDILRKQSNTIVSTFFGYQDCSALELSGDLIVKSFMHSLDYKITRRRSNRFYVLVSSVHKEDLINNFNSNLYFGKRDRLENISGSYIKESIGEISSYFLAQEIMFENNECLYVDGLVLPTNKVIYRGDYILNGKRMKKVDEFIYNLKYNVYGKR